MLDVITGYIVLSTRLKTNNKTKYNANINVATISCFCLEKNIVNF